MGKLVLNHGQQETVDEGIDFILNSPEQLYQIAGPAGTGKSVVLNSIIKGSGIKSSEIAPMAYVGAAASVMRLKGLTNAKTAHSWLYTPTTGYDDENMNTYFDRPNSYIKFEPKALTGKKLIIVDEAGQIPYSIGQEIMKRGIKVIAAGDLNQLPPVGEPPLFLYSGKVHYLTEIMRQAENSAIIYLANRAAIGLPIHNGFYGDVLVIDEDELCDDMIKVSQILICGKNKTRDKFNNYIRQDVLGIVGELPTHGERLICRKNNWRLEVDGINLANGLTGYVSNFPDVRSFDKHTFNITFQPNLFRAPFVDLTCDYDYFKAPISMKEKLKNNKFNKGEKFELGYSITTHISQGSQYNVGIYYEEYLNEAINRNLNYTGITRFSKFLIYVKAKRKFY